jgi:type IV pilus assembly protein PilB
MARKKLGEVLRDRGKISEKEVLQLLADHQGKSRLGELLLERGIVNKEDLIEALEDITRVPYVDCTELLPNPEALGRVPYELARKHRVLPLAVEDGKLVVAMAEPQDLEALDALRFRTGMDIVPRLAFRNEVTDAIPRHYATLDEPMGEKGPVRFSLAELGDIPEMEFITTSSRQSQREAMIEFQAELRNQRTPAVRVVSSLIAQAVEKGASDIHIEPQAAETVVRIRVDGVLRDLQRIPRALQHPLISRVKILADMDIAERRVPQDGGFLVQIGKRKMDMRVSSLPTHNGEKIVIRLLDSNGAQANFEELGLPADIIANLKRVLALPQGMMLVTGPTGSGKSTTLYAALSHVHKPTVNIVTVEDPVEYKIEGINQVQVNSKAGLNFANVLRSILRQDPNVIMVGEIRDRETAEIALKASQTGHLVLSTLHTNDSVSAITRLLDLDIPAFLVASSVSAIMAQRLVRRLCTCRLERRPTAEYIARMAEAGIEMNGEKMSVPAGCEACDGTGYRGRVGIYELLTVDDAVRQIIRSGGHPEEIRAAGRAAGFRTIQEDAIEKIRSGVTTLEEVLRVIALEPVSSTLCSGCAREVPAAFRFCPSCGAERKPPARATRPQPLSIA